MIINSKPKVESIKIFLLFFISLILSLAILNRWVITDLGLASFGRVWQYYVSYFDYGFLRRSFFGTFLDITHINKIIADPYIFSYVLYAFKILLVSIITLTYLLKNRVFDNIYGYAAIFLSPAFILQLAYSTGTQDLELIIILCIIFFYVRTWSLLILLSIIGVMIHELYVFLFPAALLCVYIKRNNGFEIIPREVFKSIIISIILFISLLFVLNFGVEVDQKDFEETMANKMNYAAYNHPLWSGYYEIFSSVHQNADDTGSALSNIYSKILYLIIPVSYMILWAFLNSYYSKEVLWKKIIIFIFLVFPILTSFVASDFYRWVGMSVNLSIFFAIMYSKIKGDFIPKKMFILLLLFSVFAPFGAAELERPFPAHQLIIEKFFNL